MVAVLCAPNLKRALEKLSIPRPCAARCAPWRVLGPEWESCSRPHFGHHGTRSKVALKGIYRQSSFELHCYDASRSGARGPWSAWSVERVHLSRAPAPARSSVARALPARLTLRRRRRAVG